MKNGWKFSADLPHGKWLRHAGVQWGVWIVAVLVSFIIISKGFETQGSSRLREGAYQMLTNGISTTNQAKAIELLLYHAYSFTPAPNKAHYPNWFFLLLIGGLAYCVALSFPPHVEIAVGRGERRIRFWRKYSKFILITTPTFAFMTFMWPKIEHILKSLF